MKEIIFANGSLVYINGPDEAVLELLADCYDNFIEGANLNPERLWELAEGTVVTVRVHPKPPDLPPGAGFKARIKGLK